MRERERASSLSSPEVDSDTGSGCCSNGSDSGGSVSSRTR